MNKITKVTRKGILLDLYTLGDLDLEKYILDFFSAEKLESFDDRHKNLLGDFHQHRVNNNDWEDDWFITDERLDFFGISDDKFLSFLSFLLSPENSIDYQDDMFKEMLRLLNEKLLHDSFEIVDSGKKEGGKIIYIGKNIIGGNKVINFYSNDFTGDKNFPCIVLYYTDWDDFNWKTTFKTRLCIKFGKSVDLGQVNILYKDYEINKRNHYKTIIPKSFSTLNNNYCSVFSSDESLTRLNRDSLRDYKKSILEGLREATYNEKILKEFKDVVGFNVSLLRSTEAFARVQNIEKQLLNFSLDHFNGNVSFKFEKDELPYRINTLIGKNGCGKTSLLVNLAKELVEYDLKKTTLSKRPSFSKVIQVSYSVFDSFQRPENIDYLKYKYIYCGLQDCGKEVTANYLETKLSNALNMIESKSKGSVYIYLLRELLDNNEINLEQLRDNFNSYSSGQKILITILAEIIANIDENSLLLFDEPETHLHPNMIFKLIKILYELLDDNNSYLIIATHSPIVIQQIPRKCVNIIDKGGNKKLNLECFGENFSELTKEIFGSYESDEILYKDIFRKLLKKRYSEEGILDLFGGKLSLSARIYLRALFNEKKQGET